MSVDGYKKGKSRRERKKFSLHRSVDGRIKSSEDGDADIGDVWAQQERIGFNQVIEDEKRKKDRQLLKKERGLIGIARQDLSGLTSKVKSELFGEQAARHGNTKQQNPYMAHDIDAFVASKEPKPKLRKRIGNWIGQRTSGLSESMRPVLLTMAGIAAVLLIIFGGYVIFKGVYSHFHKGSNYASNGKGKDVLGLNTDNKLDKSTQKYKGTPDFKTITRDGKDVNDFGGWYVVSGQAANPVYAYPDNLAGNILTVSEQPESAKMKASPDAQLESVAHNKYVADRLLEADGMKIYIGTKKSGAQTGVFTKDGLLIAINTTKTLEDRYWIAYALRMK